MKMRFTSLDLSAQLTHLRETVVGMRVNQVYDIDHKSYILKLQQPEKKVMLLFESGSRIHTTEFEWPKNPAPSGFSMKLRKHVNNKRLEAVEQLGVDRVVDLRFGSDEAAYHVILELYDRGNVVLTDFEYKILNILRPRVQGEEKFLVRETYPVELARQDYKAMNEERLRGIFEAAKPGDSLKKMLAPQYVEYKKILTCARTFTTYFSFLALSTARPCWSTSCWARKWRETSREKTSI
jgi:predicted ribosome quality control (RQC) complex YloA/Tae2 family protein